jgi:hypothetical protein
MVSTVFAVSDRYVCGLGDVFSVWLGRDQAMAQDWRHATVCGRLALALDRLNN